MKNIPAIFLLTVLFSVRAMAGGDTLRFAPATEKLRVTGDSLLQAANDSIRLFRHQEFSRQLDSLLLQPGACELSFGQIKALSTCTSENGDVKCLSWMLPMSNGNKFLYSGYILYKIRDKKDKTANWNICHLHQCDTLQRDLLEFLKSDSGTWIGCVYYDVIHKKYNKKDYYLLLGWAPQSTYITRKMVETLVISSRGINIGAPQIKVGGKTRTRLVFEYNAQAVMSLRYSKESGMVIMDHLSPSDPRPEAKGMYHLYGPDMSYDGLKFSKGFWTLQKDIDVRN